MSVPFKLEEYDINRLKSEKTPRRQSSKGVTQRNVLGLIGEFIDRGCDCCRVCTCDNVHEAHMENTILRRAVQYGNFGNVVVIQRGASLYLVKKNVWEGCCNDDK